MDVVQIFNDELQSLFDTKPPVSKAKMGQITRAAMKGVKFYKHIVQSVEKFIAKCRSEYKVPGLYVVDSIVRQSRHQFGVERDVYAARFARNLQVTFNNLFSGCHQDDKPKIVRVLNLWQKNGVFDAQIIAPLLDMANPGASLTMVSESTLSANSPPLETSKHAQTSKYIVDHFNNSSNNNRGNSSPTSRKPHEGGLRFSKNMLDFDYDEDDDGDETPTEAEPPLSSTLSKIEMEHRSKRGEGDTSQSSHIQSVSNQIIYTRNDQDPVLERWNRLIKPQPALGQSINEHASTNHTIVSAASNSNQKRPRSRSRSPSSRPKHEDNRRRDHHQSHSSSGSRSKGHSESSSSKSMSAEKEAERAKKCLPKIRDKHLTVCSSTLWLGHVPKTISEADISDAFGEYGTINSIDLIPPRGCAYVCMDRRQDAKKALSESRDLKLNGSHIKMAWAPGKGFKEYKKLKDFWESDIGASYIPYNKLDSSIDFDVLEEGGVIDEDSMSAELKETRERRAKEKSNKTSEESSTSLPLPTSLPPPTLPILNQPPPFAIPPPNLSIPPPTALMGGAIPFPPPHVANMHQLPAQSMPPNGAFDQVNQSGQQQQQDADNVNSPNAIDQQLSMTERQISMVEQQLSMIQQAQNMGGHHQPAPVMAPQLQAAQAIFAQSQPNPLLFDPQQFHLQSQVPIFNPQVIGHNMNAGPSQMPPYSHHQ